MASIISQLKESSAVDVNDVSDYSGSGFINESGIYNLVVDKAWVIESQGGAIGIHVEFSGDGMLEQDIYITNKDKQTFYTRNGKDSAMPGYIEMKKLNYIVTGNFLTSLSQLNVQNRIVKTYEMIDDPENEGKKKRSPIEKEVEYLVDWAGKELKVGIQMAEKEETKQQGDKWVGTGKRAENDKGEPYLDVSIIGFYNAETNQTANEMKNDKDAEQIDKDIKRLEKSPVRAFKAKKGGSKAKGTSSSSGAVQKPSIF